MSHSRLTLALRVFAAFIALSVLGVSAEAKSRGTKIEPGEAKQIGHGTATSWVEVKKDGTPVSIGVTFDKEALSGLPAEDTEYTLALPKSSVTGFQLIGVNWNPHGHIPPGIYDVPHFDFHFFLIGPEQRDEITATGSNLDTVRKPPSAEYVPKDYIFAPGSEFPQEGSHWIDPNSPEFHGQPFTATFIYGTYNGMIDFVEPMVTKKFFETDPSVKRAVKLPQAYQKTGYYPDKYSVHYDKAVGKYTVAIRGLRLRQAAAGRTTGY